MNLKEKINQVFTVHLEKAICLSIVKSKYNAVDFLYVKYLNSLANPINKIEKNALKDLVQAKFYNELLTQRGLELLHFYNNEKYRKKLIEKCDLNELKTFLLSASERETLIILDGYIENGNLNAVKLMQEVRPYELEILHTDYSYCLYAIDSNQKELFDYFISISQQVIDAPQDFIMSFAARAINTLNQPFLEHILGLGKTDIDKLLTWAIIEPDFAIQSFLVDQGACLESIKTLNEHLKKKAIDLQAYRLSQSLQKQLPLKDNLSRVKV